MLYCICLDKCDFTTKVFTFYLFVNEKYCLQHTSNGNFKEDGKQQVKDTVDEEHYECCIYWELTDTYRLNIQTSSMHAKVLYLQQRQHSSNGTMHLARLQQYSNYTIMWQSAYHVALVNSLPHKCQ